MQIFVLHVNIVGCFASVPKNGRVEGREEEKEAKAIESVIVKTWAPQLASDSCTASPGTICLQDTETWELWADSFQLSYFLVSATSWYLGFWDICILGFWKSFQNDALHQSIVCNFDQPLVDKSSGLTMHCFRCFLCVRNCLGISCNCFILKVKAFAWSVWDYFSFCDCSSHVWWSFSS